jgi:hypothetical protein
MVTVSFVASLVGVGILIIAGIVLVIRYSRLIPKLKSVRDKGSSAVVSQCDNDIITIDNNQRNLHFITSPQGPRTDPRNTESELTAV